MSGELPIVAGVAGRYATAVFELALEDDALDQVGADLDLILEALDQSADFARLVRSPVFSAQDRLNALAAVLESLGISGLTANFLGLVARNRRLFVIREMITGYRALLAAHRGEVTADVIAADRMSDTQISALGDALKDAVGKTVQMNVSVDPGLLGGLVVKIGSRMIDNSLRTKLNNLKIAMKEVG